MTASPFPPRTAFDIAAYEQDECVAGFMGWRPDDPVPGDNHSPSYRWGWTNAARDHSSSDDGYDGLRFAFIELRRAA